MDNKLGIGDILYCDDTGEQLLLLGRRVMERFETNRIDSAWDMVDLDSGNQFWEWEFVLEDSETYRVIA